MVRQLRPWHQNLKKRQVKSPKVYVADSGHRAGSAVSSEGGRLVGGLRHRGGLENSPTRGGVLLGHTHRRRTGLLLFVRGRRYGVEVKFQDAPRLTPSMRIALEDLGRRRLTVLYPLERRVDVVPLAELARRGADALIAGSRPRREGT